MNNEGRNLIKSSEKLSLVPYLDPSKKRIPTIGYGNTFYPDGTPVKMTDKPLTEAQAEKLFSTIVLNFEKKVKSLLSVSVNQNQLSALVSFAYNVGIGNFQTSTLLKKVNSNASIGEIQNEFNRWVHTGTTVLDGLVVRRKKEFDLYCKKSFSAIIVIPLILFFYSVLAITL